MLIIGLGNKEQKYQKTRHNAGYLFADYLNGGFSGESLKTESEVFKGLSRKDNNRVVPDFTKYKAVKTACFMNQSGKEVVRILGKTRIGEASGYYPAGVVPDFLIVHDDMDIPLGKFKISFGVSASGHKGVLSIIEELGTKDFWRIRIGVAPHHYDHHEHKAEDFVLQDFNPEELVELQRVFERITKNPVFREGVFGETPQNKSLPLGVSPRK